MALLAFTKSHYVHIVVNKGCV